MISLLLVVAAATMTMAEQAVDATPIIIRASSAGKVDDFMLSFCCGVEVGGGKRERGVRYFRLMIGELIVCPTTTSHTRQHQDTTKR